jgi:hypothetical protein
MVWFAKACLLRMSEVTEELEVTLGPDANDSGFRLGLHSGPVTAGGSPSRWNESISIVWWWYSEYCNNCNFIIIRRLCQSMKQRRIWAKEWYLAVFVGVQQRLPNIHLPAHLEFWRVPRNDYINPFNIKKESWDVVCIKEDKRDRDETMLRNKIYSAKWCALCEMKWLRVVCTVRVVKYSKVYIQIFIDIYVWYNQK